MNPSQNTKIVLDLLEAAWNRGDVSAIDRALAEDHIEHEPDGDENRLADTIHRRKWPDDMPHNSLS